MLSIRRVAAYVPVLLLLMPPLGLGVQAVTSETAVECRRLDLTSLSEVSVPNAAGSDVLHVYLGEPFPIGCVRIGYTSDALDLAPVPQYCMFQRDPDDLSGGEIVDEIVQPACEDVMDSFLCPGCREVFSQSSIVFLGCVYRYSDYGGAKLCFNGLDGPCSDTIRYGVPDLSVYRLWGGSSKTWNDRISSADLSGGGAIYDCGLSLYENKNYNQGGLADIGYCYGKCPTFNVWINDEASSLRFFFSEDD
jgi:hypothetical protein